MGSIGHCEGETRIRATSVVPLFAHPGSETMPDPSPWRKHAYWLA